jgi:hypothetical protein
MEVIIHPFCTYMHRNRPFRPTSALPMPSVGVPASPWMWAKARSKLGALIRPCGDGVVSNVARMGAFDLHGSNNPPLLHMHRNRNRPFRPTSALPMPSVGVPASPWMWAKARSKLEVKVEATVGVKVVFTKRVWRKFRFLKKPAYGMSASK